MISAGGLRRFATDGRGTLQAGTETVCSDEPLEGVILFGGSVGLAGVPSNSVLTSGLIAPMETSTEGFVNTGVALMNLREEELTLQLELCDEDRNVLATAQVVLAAGAQLARFVTELAWDTPPNFASFSGLLKAAFTGRLAAIVIQTRGKQFATMPIADPTVPLQ